MNDVIEPKTIDDLFVAFGGQAKVGRIIQKGASTASEMRRRGNIPVSYWPRLIAAAEEASPPILLTAETLMRMHQKTTTAETPPPTQVPASADA